MTHPPTDLPPVGVILTSSHWPDRVRVVRVEPRGTTRVLVEAVTLDDQSRVKAEPSAVTPGGSGEPLMRRSDEVEAAAMARAVAYEQERGWKVEDVSAKACGYDLLSRGLDDQARYVEVKGRAAVGAVELLANEWFKAKQLGEDYWLYVVTSALTAPELYLVQDPARRLPREEVVPKIRYRVTKEGWGHVAERAVEYKTSLTQGT